MVRMPKLDTLGRILSGKYTNWYILVEDAKYGASIPVDHDYNEYYVFTVKYNIPAPELTHLPEYWEHSLGYDSYYTSWEDLEQNFKWIEVEWLEGEEIFFGHRYYFKNNPRP